MDSFPPKAASGTAVWVSSFAGIRRLLFAASVLAICVVTYVPAVRDSFISDDFTMLPFVRMLSTNPAGILQWPSELFRAVSYIYFAACLKVFGAVPQPFYWCGIALHVLVSLLVGRLVLGITKTPSAACAATLFFAAYERHQEAVMWISAVNDTLLTFFCLVFLLLWDHSASHPDSAWSYRMSLAALFVAAFSKEAWVAMVPLAVLLLVLKGWPGDKILRRSMPLIVMLAAYVALWLSQSSRNFFITEGHYGLTWHFFPVYAKSLVRVLSQALLLLVPLAIRRYRQARFSEVSELLRSPVSLFFVAVTALTIVPYSFLTYLDQIPSRNTYLPSVGLAALVGILFAYIHSGAVQIHFRALSSAFLLLVVVANSTYIWTKKEPQFRERAEPTRALLATLNGSEFRDVSDDTVYVCGFPLHVSIGETAVEGFTRFGPGRIAFLEHCQDSAAARVLQWNADEQTYSIRSPGLESGY